jgi:hypothetical protein
MEDRSDWSITDLIFKRNSKGPIASRTRQGLLEARQMQEKKHMSKVKGRICYTCRLKEHLSQDCPKRNKSEPKVLNSTSYVHGKTNTSYVARKVISSPCILLFRYYHLVHLDLCIISVF